MKELFNFDNPFIQFLARVGELMIANFLFLLCCLPVFTTGASATALHKVTQGIVGEAEKGVVKTFFRSFRENFRQATAAWLAMLVFFAGMGCNLLLIAAFFAGNTALALRFVVGILTAVMLCVAAYLFPLLARYSNTLREHCINAGVLAVIKLPRTIGMVLLHTLPFWIMYVSMAVFLRTLVFWLVIGFGVVSYLCSMLLAPVFAQLESGDRSNIKIMD